MSDGPKVAKIVRRRRAEGDDDENDNEQAPQVEVAEQQKKKSSRPKAPKAMEVAPDAAHMDPVAMGGGAPPCPVPPSAAAAAMAAMGGRPEAPPVAGGGEDIFEIAYDTYTANDLYALLKRVTRQEVEKRMVEHEQLRQRQQQVPQVERFLDATSKTGSSSGGGGGGKSTEEGCGYNYSVMLRRLFFALNRNKESSAMTERNKLPEPKLEKIGKKKVIITNFGRICQAFNRPIQDVKDYIEKELSVGGNLDSNDALILKYEIQKSTAFDNILYKYLDEFVKCNSCHKIDTTLTKEGRRMELRCNWCTATRTVQAVGSATYSAQVGKRSKARLQAMTL